MTIPAPEQNLFFIVVYGGLYDPVHSENCYHRSYIVRVNKIILICYSFNPGDKMKKNNFAAAADAVIKVLRVIESLSKLLNTDKKIIAEFVVKVGCDVMNESEEIIKQHFKNFINQQIKGN